MFVVEIAPRALAAFHALPADRAVELMHKIDAVERLGVARERKIGELAPNLRVYLLFVADRHVVCVLDDRQYPPSIAVTDILRYVATDLALRRRFVVSAAGDYGIAATGVTVL